MEKYKTSISMPVKEGEFFATIIGQHERSSNQFINLKINEKYRELTKSTIALKKIMLLNLLLKEKD